jgi:hypothetical protein
MALKKHTKINRNSTQENILRSMSTGHIKVFLLRYQDSTDHEIKHEGPFKDEDKAKERLSSLLRKGICSWLVSQNE